MPTRKNVSSPGRSEVVGASPNGAFDPKRSWDFHSEIRRDRLPPACHLGSLCGSDRNRLGRGRRVLCLHKSGVVEDSLFGMAIANEAIASSSTSLLPE